MVLYVFIPLLIDYNFSGSLKQKRNLREIEKGGFVERRKTDSLKNASLYLILIKMNNWKILGKKFEQWAVNPHKD